MNCKRSISPKVRPGTNAASIYILSNYTIQIIYITWMVFLSAYSE